MKIIFVPLTSEYVATSKFHEKEILKEAGFRWDGDRKQWVTKDKDVAKKLRHTMDAAALETIKASEAEGIETKKASAQVEAPVDFTCPAPEGMTFMPHQLAGIYFATKKRNVLIADEPGVGKSAQAIGVINVSPHISRVLIVCPASLKLNWLRELTNWLVEPAHINILDTKKPRIVGDPEAKLKIWVVNYDIAGRFDFSEGFDLMVLDESHSLKNGKSKRRLAIWGGRKKEKDGTTKCYESIPALKTIAMTGTPICNRPKELWTTLQALLPAKMKDVGFLPWHKRYCAGVQTRFGWDFDGASNLEELNDFLRSNLMIRRTKEEVLKDLPEKRRKTTPLEPPAGISKLLLQEGALQEILDKGLENASAEALEVVQQLINSTDPELDEDGNPKDQTAVGLIARIRKEVGVVKAPLVAEYAKQLLEEHESLVIMAHHKDVIEILSEELAGYGVVKLDGSTKNEDRQTVVEKFQAGEARVFVGSITAAGVGITLTRASHTLFGEVDWTPGNMTQAEDRTHRHGQKNAVTCEYLIFEGSIDTKMIETLDSKNSVIAVAMA